MKKYLSIGLLLFIVTISTAQNSVSVLNYDHLLHLKAIYNEPQSQYPAYIHLLEEANSALKEGVFSVMDKTQIPPSGDKHDYISYGPYWWPDPKQEDGKPWIRQDGKVNPQTRLNNSDYGSKNKVFHNIETLSLAYFFTDKKIYADMALELLQVWFINAATKMNPNLNHAQAIPGKNTGRGIGVIEFAGIRNIIKALEILDVKKALDDKTKTGMRNWLTFYTKWLQTSENGVFAKHTKNNHGVWYDVQLVSLFIYLKEPAKAKKILEHVKTERIAKQITAKGEQPHELERTKSLSYCIFNLKGFTELAYLGKQLDVDLWSYMSPEGASIPKAFQFLEPYAKGKKEWDFKQISGIEKAYLNLKRLFVKAGVSLDVKSLLQVGCAGLKQDEFVVEYFCEL